MVKKRKINSLEKADGLEKADKGQRLCSEVVRKPSALSKNEKRQRLCSMVALSAINESQLAHVMQSVAEIYEDPDVAIHRTSILRRGMKEATKVLTTISLPKRVGDDFFVEVGQAGPSFAIFQSQKRVVQRCVDKRDSTMWSPSESSRLYR